MADEGGVCGRSSGSQGGGAEPHHVRARMAIDAGWRQEGYRAGASQHGPWVVGAKIRIVE